MLSLLASMLGGGGSMASNALRFTNTIEMGPSLSSFAASSSSFSFMPDNFSLLRLSPSSLLLGSTSHSYGLPPHKNPLKFLALLPQPFFAITKSYMDTRAFMEDGDDGDDGDDYYDDNDDDNDEDVNDYDGNYEGGGDGIDCAGNENNGYGDSDGTSMKTRMKAGFLGILREIKPLDTTEISKDASLNCMDAMKRTISGLLGLLPSDQFQVTVDASNRHLAQLLLSSIMTGYTLRNAEYRLGLRNIFTDSNKTNLFSPPPSQQSDDGFPSYNGCDVPPLQVHLASNSPNSEEFNLAENLGPLSKESEHYINELRSKLDIVTMELERLKKKRRLVVQEGLIDDPEEKNELLNYLRSLDPDKIEELSKPTSGDVQEAIVQFIEGMLGSLSIQRPDGSSGKKKDMANLDECGWGTVNNDGSLQIDISTSRDYLANLLFWCMLVGHYLRGVEYRFELSQTFKL